MILIMLSIFIWTPAVLGWGSFQQLFLKNLHIKDLDISPYYKHFFKFLFGAAFLSIMGNFINIFIPIDGVVSSVLWIIGFIFFIKDHGSISFILKSKATYTSYFLSFIYISFQCSKGLRKHDAGLYYLQSVKWISESKITLGLANLHGRFGLNQTWFTFTSVLELPFMFEKASLFINGLLLLSFALLLIGSFVSLFSKQVKTSNLFLVGASWFALKKARYIDISCGSPDFPIDLLIFFMIFTSLSWFETNHDKEKRYYLFSLWMSYLFGLSVKLSLAPLGLLPFALLLHQYFTKGISKNLLVIRDLTVFPVTFLIGWLFKGPLVSGYLFYPSPYFRFNFPWTVSKGSQIRQYDGVKAWARDPTRPIEEVLKNSDWIPTWWNNFRHMYVWQPTLVCVSLGLLFFMIGQMKKSKNGQIDNLSPRCAQSLVFIPLLASITFWFLTAPDGRFGQGYFWSFGLLSLSFGGYSALNSIKSFTLKGRPYACHKVLGGITVIALVANSSFLQITRLKNWTQWPHIPNPSMGRTLTTTDGYEIFIADPFCYNAKRPCAFYADPNMKVIKNNKGEVTEFRLPECSPEYQGCYGSP